MSEDDDDVPWVGLYRRALAHGISDGAFWRMSPAALIAVTEGGRRTGARPAAAGDLIRPAGTFPKGEGLVFRGGLCDCP